MRSLRLVWDKNILLFTWRLRMMNIVIDSSYARTTMNCTDVSGINQTYTMFQRNRTRKNDIINRNHKHLSKISRFQNCFNSSGLFDFHVIWNCELLRPLLANITDFFESIWEFYKTRSFMASTRNSIFEIFKLEFIRAFLNTLYKYNC